MNFARVITTVGRDRGSWCLMALVETTMLPSLPPEIFDLIVDNLHYEPTTLEACCLVSSSWIPRARRHLFARTNFLLPESIGSWMKAFPDPSNSPARYTRTVYVHVSAIAPMTSSDASPWVRAFHLVKILGLEGRRKDHSGFSGIIHLICSFPLLEDLWLEFSVSGNNIGDSWDTPSSSPKLSGVLTLHDSKACPIVPQLLRLPGGIHFAKIVVVCSTEVTQSIPDLVSRCSHTLESLVIRYYRSCAFPSSPVAGLYPIPVIDSPTPTKTIPLDLSQARNLRVVDIWSSAEDVEWITKSLRSIQSENFRRIKITVKPPSKLINPIGEMIQRELADLDRILVKLWTSHSVFLKVRCERRLLPEITSREGVRVSGI